VRLNNNNFDGIAKFDLTKTKEEIKE